MASHGVDILVVGIDGIRERVAVTRLRRGPRDSDWRPRPGLHARTVSRFAAEELRRTKTDAIDALGIARFAAQRRPAASRLPDPATEELRELLRYRDRLSQDFGDRERQLHRLLDRGFPEFPR